MPKAEIVKWGGEGGSKEDLKNWGYVWADRNRAIDAVIEDFLKGNILMSLTREELEKYIIQWETLRRVEEQISLGTRKYKWESTTGEDHWAHATVYYWIGRSRMTPAFFVPEKDRPKDMIVRTSEGFEMRNLREILEENE